MVKKSMLHNNFDDEKEPYKWWNSKFWWLVLCAIIAFFFEEEIKILFYIVKIFDPSVAGITSEESILEYVNPKISRSLSFISPIVTFIVLEKGIVKITQLSSLKAQELPLGLPVDLFINEISESTEKVVILDSYLDILLRDDDSHHKSSFKKALTKAIHQGSSIEILILDPNGEGTKLRAQELHGMGSERSIDEAMGKIRTKYDELIHMKSEIISDLRSKVVDVESKFKLSVIQEKPDFVLHQCDDVAYWAFFPKDKMSTKETQLKVNPKNVLGKYLNKAFDDLSSKATPVV